MKKFAMHVHTAPFSGCAKVECADMIKMYKEKGYDGIFLTNHYMKWVLENYYTVPKQQATEFFLSGYHEAKKLGNAVGMEVYLGMELNLEQYNEPDIVYPFVEFLVYGMTEELLLQNREIYNFSVEELVEFCKKNDLVCFQAHPFRKRAKTCKAEQLMGVEAYNGNIRHYSFNDVAEKFANDNNLLKVFGDDFHEPEDVGKVCTWFEDDCKTLKDYVHALQQGKVKGEVF